MTHPISRAIRQGLFLTTASAALLLAGCAAMNPPAQNVSIVEPADGAVVGSPFKLRFGVKGMAVAPAGTMTADTGHHHLLINLDAIAAGSVVPFTEGHMHFGKGQTEAEITLPPGTYKLTAQFANGAHQSYGKPMSQTITVTVK
jgi:Domain of unknown function (DUF4399)